MEEIKGVIRTLIVAAQARWDRKLPFGHPIALWAPIYTAQVPNGSGPGLGDDGNTAYQNTSGKRWKRVAVSFGERTIVKRLVEDALKRDLEPRWVTGYYTGHTSRSGTALALTAKGAQRGTAVARLPPDQRWAWAEVEILGVRGKPWDCQGDDDRCAAAPADAAPRARPMDAPVVIFPPPWLLGHATSAGRSREEKGDANLSLPDEALRELPRDFATRPLALWRTPRNVPLPGEALKYAPQDLATRPLALWPKPRRSSAATLSLLEEARKSEPQASLARARWRCGSPRGICRCRAKRLSMYRWTLPRARWRRG